MSDLTAAEAALAVLLVGFGVLWPIIALAIDRVGERQGP